MIEGFKTFCSVTDNKPLAGTWLDRVRMISVELLAVHDWYYVAASERLQINVLEEKLKPVGNEIFISESTYRFESTVMSKVNVQ